MSEQERIQAWVDKMEGLKKRAVKVAREAREKEWEYYDIMKELADCERAIQECREPNE